MLFMMIAIASEGNPHAFIAMSAVQATNNIFLSPPIFYDAELDSNGNPTTEAQMMRRNLNKDVAASATNMFRISDGAYGRSGTSARSISLMLF